MKERILLVDDDPNVLAAYSRQLRNLFEIETATGHEAAFELMNNGAPFAVVVSDMKMPGMDGIEFLSNVKEMSPETVRIMLTGYADMDTAIEAVNQGSIFRFLTKPCPPVILTRVIRDAVIQYRLVMSEKELLEKTLSGSVRVLTEILSVVNPEAFSRTNRLSHIINFVVNELKLEPLWEYQVAGMLSQIGWVTLPPDILDKVYANETLEANELAMYQEHPHTAERFLSNIPRLENISQMIARQLEPDLAENLLSDPQSLGARLIQMAAEYDKATMNGMSHSLAVARLRQNSNSANLRLVEALAAYEKEDKSTRNAIKRFNLDEFRTSLILEEDVITDNGTLLASKGQEITSTVLLRLKNFARTQGIREPILVRIPA